MRGGGGGETRACMVLKGKQSGNSFKRNIVSLCSGTTLLASSPLDILSPRVSSERVAAA